MSTEPVRYTLEGTTAIVQMDDGKANALSKEMIDALIAAITRAESEASAIIIAGRPERFSGGFDLKVMMSGPENATALLRHGVDLFMKLYAAPLPVVMACAGHALAGGSLLLLTGDVRVGAAGPYRIGLNEVSIGLPVPLLAIELMRDRIITTEIGRATLEATIYGPEDAARVGYLDIVVPAADVLTKAKEEAARLAALSRSAYAATKMRLRKKTIAQVLGSLEEDFKDLLAPYR